MILNEAGQTFRYGQNVFMIGDFAAVFTEPAYGMCGLIKELDTEAHSALCNFGSCDTEISLENMTSLASEMPGSTERMYALYYICDGPDDQSVKVQGVSASKHVLLHLMQENIRCDPALEMVHSKIDKEKDSLLFTYEDALENFSLSYHIVSVPDYSKTDGGMIV